MLLGVAHAAPPQCEMSDEVNRAMTAARAAKNDAERAAELRALVVKYPDDLFVHEVYLHAAANVDYVATRAEYTRRREQSATEPRWAYLDALLVSFANREEGASRMRTVALPRAHFRLAGWLQSAKDSAGARRELASYLADCPQALDAYGLQSQLSEKADRPKVAAKLRAQLRDRTDVTALSMYGTLWKLESQSTPPQGLPAWRKLVAADLARLRASAPTPTPTPALVPVLEEGYQILSDREGLAWSRAQRPKDAMAFWRDLEEWTKSHAAPATKSARADRFAYMAAQHAASAEWVKTYPDVDAAWAFRLETSPRAMPIAEVKAIAARVLLGDEDSEVVASEYAARGIEPDRVIAMTLRRLAKREQEWANVRAQPARFAWRLGDLDQEEATTRVRAWDVLSQAYFDKRDLPHAREMAEKIAAYLAKMKPDEEGRTGVEVNYWGARGRQARLEKKLTDALGFFLKAHALETALDDWELAALWKEMGGGDEAYALLGGQVAAKIAPTSSWRTKDQRLPALQLEDLAGKKWRSADWRGKTVVMVVWATWCAPCKEELPHLEKLYQTMKSRADVVIVSLNVDEQVGLVEPFLVEKKYTFPVLLANDWGRELRAGGIPLTMIADRSFTLRRDRAGYGENADVDWGADMRATIDAVTKAGAASR